MLESGKCSLVYPPVFELRSEGLRGLELLNGLLIDCPDIM